MEKKSAARRTDPKRKRKKDGAVAKAGVGKRGAAAPVGEISGKDYARKMKKLHVELVKLQEWVKLKGLKVCVVFEGRDGSPRRPSARNPRCTCSAICRTCRPLERS
jgi:polyphosphate kinase 2 (PPK2 family)